MKMDLRELSLSIGYALSAYGVTAVAEPAIAQSGEPDTVSTSPSLAGGQCGTSNRVNSCRPTAPMRALTADDIALIAGANNTTESSGSCSAAGCHVTASPISSNPPSSGTPPGNPGGPGDGGGGGGDPGGGSSGDSGGTNPPVGSLPTAPQQDHAKHCAAVYGNTSEKAGYHTSFLPKYGWSWRTAEGVATGEFRTSDSQPPADSPTPGGRWQSLNGHTTLVDPLDTELFMPAYTSEAQMVETLAHEWYHQNHDVATEDANQRQANENAATAAGQAAEAAYKSDNGAKCQ
jgi:hypothetical protein